MITSFIILLALKIFGGSDELLVEYMIGCDKYIFAAFMLNDSIWLSKLIRR